MAMYFLPFKIKRDIPSKEDDMQQTLIFWDSLFGREWPFRAFGETEGLNSQCSPPGRVCRMLLLYFAQLAYCAQPALPHPMDPKSFIAPGLHAGLAGGQLTDWNCHIKFLSPDYGFYQARLRQTALELRFKMRKYMSFGPLPI